MIEHTNEYKALVTALRYELLEATNFEHSLEETRWASQCKSTNKLLFAVLKGIVKGSYREEAQEVCREFFTKLAPLYETKDLTDLCIEVMLSDCLSCEWAADYDKHMRL